MQSGMAKGSARALDEPPFWMVVDDAGVAVESVSSFLLDFWARGNAESSCESYAYALLRWFRHLEIEKVEWERAVRDTVRNFVLACRQPSKLCRKPLSPSTINHNLAVVSAFYSFHIFQLRGPLVNPVPARRASDVGRFAAHNNPELEYVRARRADFRQKVPVAAPRSLPDHRVDALTRVLEHPRDRALVEFYLSSAARPSELLGLNIEDVDPLLQLPRLGRVRGGLTGTGPVFDVGLAEPVLQGRFADTEVSGDLLDGDAALTATSDRDDVLAELSRIRTGHDDILPVSASRH
jgi:hypothetical protein